MTLPFSDDPAVLARKLSELRDEHRDLDTAIARLSADPLSGDMLHIKRLKKRKLRTTVIRRVFPAYSSVPTRYFPRSPFQQSRRACQR